MAHGRNIVPECELEDVRQTPAVIAVIYRGERVKVRLLLKGTAETWQGTVFWRSVVDVPARRGAAVKHGD